MFASIITRTSQQERTNCARNEKAYITRAQQAQNVTRIGVMWHSDNLLQNEFVRIIRVVIPPGESTLWHEHNFDYGVLFVNGTKLKVDETTNPQGEPRVSASKAFTYTTYAGKRFVHRVHNTDTTPNHQLAFEIIPPRPIGFAVSNRSAAPQYKMEVDKRPNPSVASATRTWPNRGPDNSEGSGNSIYFVGGPSRRDSW